jgi:hypothetical protein
MVFATYFWPLFWTVIGVGAVVTVIVSLFVATVPVARPDDQRPARPELPRRHTASTHTQAA